MDRDRDEVDDGDGWEGMSWWDAIVAGLVTVGVALVLLGIFRAIDWMMVWIS